MTSIQPIQSKIYITPNYNAVKIDINNPEVKTQEPVQEQNCSMPIYAYPKAPVYDIPKQAIYNPTQVIESPIAGADKAPVPVVTQTPIVPKPVVVDNLKPTEQAAPKQTIGIKDSEQINSKVDINEIISKLNNSDYDVQAKALSSIAKTVKDNPETATELLDIKVIDTLLGIMTKDTSGLQGPTAEQLQSRDKIMTGKPTTPAEQALANTTTPMELAERNKQYSLYTVAILQKLYASEIEKTSNNVVPLTELPGAAGIVEQLKNNPNPMVRVSSLEALSYIQRPEYKEDLTTLFTVAQSDQDKFVRETAAKALAKLAKVANAPTQPQQTTQVAPTAKQA